MRKRFRYGNTFGRDQDVAERAAAVGDFGTLGKLPGLRPEERKFYADRGFDYLEMQERQQFTGVDTARGGTALGELSATGADYQTIQRRMNTVLREIQAQMDVEQALADRPGINPLQRRKHLLAAEQLHLGGMQLYRGGVETEYGQRGGYASAITGEAGLTTQIALMSGASGEGQLSPLFGAQSAALQEEARINFEKSQRADIYDYAQREQFKAQAKQKERE